MKVELIDYTGAGFFPKGEYAARLLVYTKSTRLEQSPDTRKKIFEEMPFEEILKELKYIAGTLRSSWEFVDYTFQISGVTRAFTHQLVRTRTASYAQQAQRVVNMSDFEALRPTTLDEETGKDWDKAIEAIKEGYRSLVAAGVPTQDARGLLPTNIKTNIIMKANLRTLADLVGKRINPRAQGEYIDFMRGCVEEMKRVHPWVEDFLFPDRKATPALDKIMTELTGDDSPYTRSELNDALKEIDKIKGIWG